MLLEDLRCTQVDYRLDRRIHVYPAFEVLTINKFGAWSYNRQAATTLLVLILARYERREHYPHVQQGPC